MLALICFKNQNSRVTILYISIAWYFSQIVHTIIFEYPEADEQFAFSVLKSEQL